MQYLEYTIITMVKPYIKTPCATKDRDHGRLISHDCPEYLLNVVQFARCDRHFYVPLPWTLAKPAAVEAVKLETHDLVTSWMQMHSRMHL